ncbi:autotransporter assembly complex protein TamA [Frigidibacter sp. MR17.24]|uniref:autotransporter assembly complex protein TamA n=1 Tax=Frigidibacter sp. MR17.24 TaxID=3127345 RepID=UPI003012E78A
MRQRMRRAVLRGLTRRAGFTVAGIGLLAATPALALDKFEIRIIGKDHSIGNAVLAASQTNVTRDEDNAQPQDLLAAAQADYGRILGALYAEGHYSGVITIAVDGREAASIPPLDAPAKIGSIIITVDPGPAFTFSNAQARPLAPKTEMPEDFAVGRPAQASTISDAAAAGVDGWRAVGYAKARLSDQQVTADHRTDTLDARLGFQPGPRVTFGRVAVSGNRRVREDAIRRIAGFPTGERFDPDEVDAVAERLRRTGAFRGIVLKEADTVRDGDKLDYSLILTEEKRRKLSFGASISSDDGAALEAGWMHRNLFGGAEKLTIDGEVSGMGSSVGGMDYNLGARLERPGTPFRDSSAFIDALAGHDEEDDYTSDNVRLTFGLTRYITDKLTGEIAFGFEGSDVTDDLGIDTSYRQLILPFSLTWDKRNNALNATEGFYLKGEIMPFYGLETTGTGAKLGFDTRAYHGFGSDDRVVIAGRFQGGRIEGAGLSQVPRDYLYYTGGGGTVRGQPYQSLGVYEIDPDLKTGGTSYAAISAELRVNVTKSIGLVTFYDAGWVSGDEQSDSQSGAGFGLRYNTGIGPIRLDVAAPVSGDTGEGMQFYIGIGQAF